MVDFRINWTLQIGEVRKPRLPNTGSESVYLFLEFTILGLTQPTVGGAYPGIGLLSACRSPDLSEQASCPAPTVLKCVSPTYKENCTDFSPRVQPFA